MIPPWVNHFGKRTELSPIYFFLYLFKHFWPVANFGYQSLVLIEYMVQKCNFCHYVVTKYSFSKTLSNKPERVFGLQVRCKELDIFKILGIFGIFGEEFFWRNFFGVFLGGIFGDLGGNSWIFRELSMIVKVNWFSTF